MALVVAAVAVAIFRTAAAPLLDEAQGLWPIVSGTLNVGGLGTLVFLFASDRILTRGQSDRRIADLVRYHEAVVEGMTARYDELRQSRDYHAKATDVQRERADAMSQRLAEVAIEAAALGGATVAAAEEVARDER